MLIENKLVELTSEESDALMELIIKDSGLEIREPRDAVEVIHQYPVKVPNGNVWMIGHVGIPLMYSMLETNHYTQESSYSDINTNTVQALTKIIAKLES